MKIEKAIDLYGQELNIYTYEDGQRKIENVDWSNIAGKACYMKNAIYTLTNKPAKY